MLILGEGRAGKTSLLRRLYHPGLPLPTEEESTKGIEEEFDTGHRQFKSTSKPFIYTFFKNAKVPMGEIGDEVLSLLAFKQKLSDLGHFLTGYEDIEHLKRQFRDQLDLLLPKLRASGEA